MTTSTSLSGRALPPRPPAKGSFPLDHLGECQEFAKAYEECLRNHKRIAGYCRHEARKYLECRMEAGLMAKEEWRKLGLAEEQDRTEEDTSTGELPQRAEKKGFVAGMRTAKRRKERARVYKRSADAEDKPD